MKYENLIPEEKAQIDKLRSDAAQERAQDDARKAQRDARLAEIPANVNSVPAMRAQINEILKELRGED